MVFITVNFEYNPLLKTVADWTSKYICFRCVKILIEPVIMVLCRFS